MSSHGPSIFSTSRGLGSTPQRACASLPHPPMAEAWPALVHAADAWRTVLAFGLPPDWLRASAAAGNMLQAYRAELADLLHMDAYAPQASVETLIVGGEIVRLWCVLQSSPHLANEPLEGLVLTFPLHAAVDPLARRGLRSATLLLQMRAAVDNRDVDRETALHVAAAFCNPPIVRLLLQKMADANLKNRLGAAPLHFAAHSGDARVVCLLLEASATDLDARRSNDDPAHDGATPILLASEGNNVMIADRSSIRPPPLLLESMDMKIFLDSERVWGGLSGRRRGTRYEAA